MGRQWPAETITTSDSLDIGTFHVRSLGAEEVPGGSKPNDTSAGGKLMYTHIMEVVAPPEFAGKQQRDNWCIGSESDRGADDPQTWQVQDGHPNYAAKSAKKCLLAAKIVLTNDFDAALAQLPGKEFLIRTKARKNNPAYVDIADYYPMGARAIGIGTTPTQQVAIPAARPVIKAVIPPGASATMTAGPKVVPKKEAKPSTMACPECDWTGLKSDFPEHANTHEDGDDE